MINDLIKAIIQYYTLLYLHPLEAYLRLDFQCSHRNTVVIGFRLFFQTFYLIEILFNNFIKWDVVKELKAI